MNNSSHINPEAAKEEFLKVSKPAYKVIYAERAELEKKYIAAQNTPHTPAWVVSARKAELDFADAVIEALPTFVFNREEYREIIKKENFIHLCWIEWNTYAQEADYEVGHDINSVEDIMDIVGEIIAPV